MDGKNRIFLHPIAQNTTNRFSNAATSDMQQLHAMNFGGNIQQYRHTAHTANAQIGNGSLMNRQIAPMLEHSYANIGQFVPPASVPDYMTVNVPPFQPLPQECPQNFKSHYFSQLELKSNSSLNKNASQIISENSSHFLLPMAPHNGDSHGRVGNIPLNSEIQTMMGPAPSNPHFGGNNGLMSHGQPYYQSGLPNVEGISSNWASNTTGNQSIGGAPKYLRQPPSYEEARKCKRNYSAIVSSESSQSGVGDQQLFIPNKIIRGCETSVSTGVEKGIYGGWHQNPQSHLTPMSMGNVQSEMSRTFPTPLQDQPNMSNHPTSYNVFGYNPELPRMEEHPAFFAEQSSRIKARRANRQKPFPPETPPPWENNLPGPQLPTTCTPGNFQDDLPYDSSDSTSSLIQSGTSSYPNDSYMYPGPSAASGAGIEGKVSGIQERGKFITHTFKEGPQLFKPTYTLGSNTNQQIMTMPSSVSQDRPTILHGNETEKYSTGKYGTNPVAHANTTEGAWSKGVPPYPPPEYPSNIPTVQQAQLSAALTNKFSLPPTPANTVASTTMYPMAPTKGYTTTSTSGYPVVSSHVYPLPFPRAYAIPSNYEFPLKTSNGVPEAAANEFPVANTSGYPGTATSGFTATSAGSYTYFPTIAYPVTSAGTYPVTSSVAYPVSTSSAYSMPPTSAYPRISTSTFSMPPTSVFTDTSTGGFLMDSTDGLNATSTHGYPVTSTSTHPVASANGFSVAHNNAIPSTPVVPITIVPEAPALPAITTNTAPVVSVNNLESSSLGNSSCAVSNSGVETASTSAVKTIRGIPLPPEDQELPVLEGDLFPDDPEDRASLGSNWSLNVDEDFDLD